MTSEADRDAVCEDYHRYFHKQLADFKNYPFHNEIEAILTAADQGDIQLSCFCAPKRCHCETIKDYVTGVISMAEQAQEGRFHG